MAGTLERPQSLSGWARRARFATRSIGRLAWYGAHRYATRRIDGRIGADYPEYRIAPPQGPVPSERRILADIARLQASDLANVEAGHYPMPAGEPDGLVGLLRRARKFYADVPDAAHRRRRAEDGEGAAANEPYYMQDFHFQADGWMSEASADLYDFQVEVLFNGSAAAMRRQGLVPLARLVRTRDQRTLQFADIACGTGNMLREVTRAFPRLPAIGIDVSEPYLRHGARRVRRARDRRFAAALAEALPLADESLDAASVVYLFHELPPEARRAVAGELGRVLKPDGVLVFIDTLQMGDEPDYDGLLELFPQLFKEPYYEGFVHEDLDALFAPHGLRREDAWNAYVSRVSVFRKG
ncbi:methyltransferase family protein [Breoghania corrubedonensis]|uniref:Methyltransferase family protein n=1 Tax=Breoghania corrubedonensis TaxID=665038 RepID=A0A2T5VEJ3_9HYPH|nr:class I SAM-dependent methyltransferase [Breoghania corrubedonensis]PTW62178.1 methyltransferase family protein [Breoghania corrubedonensis]